MSYNDYDSYYTFEKNGDFYLFDICNFLFMKITNKLYQYLTKSTKELDESNKMLLEKLKENNLFFYDIENNVGETKNETITFSYPIVHQCNLKCKYCFADADYVENLDLCEKENLIKQICEFIKKTFPGYKYRFELVSGGEPLINKDAFKMVIKSLKSHLDNLSIWVCTNATLLDEEILKFIDENNISIGISLDGNYVQNSSRVYSNGKSSYDDVVRKVNEIKKSNVSRRLKELWGLAVITSQNMCYNKILEHHKSLGFKTVQTKIVRVPEEHYLSINKNSLQDLMESIDSLFSEFISEIDHNNYAKVKLILNDNDYIGKNLVRLLTKELVERRCDAGVNKFSFSNRGDIYPCDSFMESHKCCIGNIKEGFYSDVVFLNYTIGMRGKCSKCKLRYICGGDCYYNSWVKTGKMDIPDEDFCEVNHHIFKSSLAFLEYAQREHPNIYNKIKKYAKARSVIR